MSTTTADILSAFCSVAESIRDGEFYVRCSQRKSYLTREVIARWRIGQAPTLGQCKAADLTEEQLESVGLYVQREHGKVMFFRDCMVFPFCDNGRVVYFTSRRLVDHDPRTGEALSKSAKALSMRAPDSHGDGGVLLSTGFNGDALQYEESVMLVEGPLDAIACTERGHPAIAMVGKCPRPGLLAILRKLTIPIYLALDGTADVTEEERLNKAAMVGPDCWICTLPEGRDPDDLDANALVALKAGARQCLESWLHAFKRPPQEWRQNATQAFRAHLKRWLQASPAHAEDLRARVCGVLGLQSAEWNQLIGEDKIIAQAAAAASAEVVPEEAQRFLDDQLRDRLASIQAMDGTRRDAETMRLLEELAPHLVGVSAVLRDRVKSLVCDTLKLQRKTYDLGLREARASIEREQGVTIGGDVDWSGLARGYLGALRSGQLAVS
jgi:DNA primase